jgi:hypothetical protein
VARAQLISGRGFPDPLRSPSARRAGCSQDSPSWYSPPGVLPTTRPLPAYTWERTDQRKDLMSPTPMPGRAVDIIHAAALAVGLTPWRIEIFFAAVSSSTAGDGRSIILQLDGHVDDWQARRIFAALGGGEVALSPYKDSPRQGTVWGYVPDLAAELRVMVSLSDEDEIRALVGRAGDLVAGVDAARAAEESP